MKEEQCKKIQEALDIYLPKYLDECDLDEDRGINQKDFAESFVLFLLNDGFFIFPYDRKTLELIEHAKDYAKVHADSYNNQG